MKSVTWSGGAVSGSVSYGHDSDFRIASIGSVAYTFDNDGLLTQAGALTLRRDATHGALTGTTLAALTDEFTYNEFGEVAKYTSSSGSTPLLAIDYQRDTGGRLTGITETIGRSASTSRTFEYDVAGRLERVRTGGTVVAEYGYDANGNRVEHRYLGGTDSATYDDADRLLTYGGVAYSYTPQGELKARSLAGETTTYDYDTFGNLRSVSMTGQTIDYVLDPVGRRVGRKVNGTLTHGWLYADGQRIVAELDGTSATVSQFVYASSRIVPDYIVKGGTTYRILTDHLGSVRLVVNTATGAVAQQISYDEFGRVLSDSAPGFQPFGFAGGLYDPATALVLFGARSYDPYSGRWTRRDPIGFAGTSANLYDYCHSDPINYIDPNGLATLGLAAGGSDTNAFRNRARQAAGPSDTKVFDNGQDIIRIMDNAGSIDRAVIHSHGYQEGVIGNGNEIGLYHSKVGLPGYASTQEFADAILSGHVNITRGGKIVFYGCNLAGLAQDLSARLGAGGRRDIRVTGANESVYEENGRAYVDKRGKFITYQAGSQVATWPSLPYN